MVQSILKCIVAGIVIAVISTFTIGYTAAIAAPKELFDWFIIRDLKITILVLWDVFVIYFPGLGITAVLISYFVVNKSSLKWVHSSILIIIANLVFIILASPIIHGTKFNYLHLEYWQHSYEVVLIACVFMSGYVSTRFNKSLNKDATNVSLIS